MENYFVGTLLLFGFVYLILRISLYRRGRYKHASAPSKFKTLLSMCSGESATIVKVIPTATVSTDQLQALGFIEGETITFLGRAPMGDPLEVFILNTRLCLRKVDAESILIKDLKKV